MPVDDLWYLSKRGPSDERLPSQRHGRGKRYRARWVDDSGQARTRLFERKVDAERHEVNQRADVSRGQYIDQRAGKTTVREYGAQWRREQLHRASTERRTADSARLHIDPILGDLPMNAVRTSHLKNWVKDRSQILNPATLRVVFSQLTSMFTAAALDRMIGVSPCVGVRLPEIDRGDRFIPTPDQVHALAQALTDRTVTAGPGAPYPSRRYAAMVYVAAGCGLRPGEVMGLELGDIDFLRREIRVERQLVTLAGRAPYLCQLKTKTSRRTVEMGSVTGEALAEHIRQFPPVPVDVDDETDPRKLVRRKALLMFTNTHSMPIHRSNWSHRWGHAVKAAGLPAGDIGLHTLRHYFATLLIHGGASVKTVQLALGHSTPTITLNTYVHEWPDVLERTRSLVDAALGKPRAAGGLKAV